MFKRLLWRWYYRRAKDKLNNVDTRLLPILKYYRSLLRAMSFNKAEYRDRMRYSVFVKTVNLGEFLLKVDTITKLIEINARSLDLEQRFTMRQRRRLDSWLVDTNSIVFNEIEAANLVLSKLDRLVDILDDVQSNNNPLYMYYEDAGRYLIRDVFDVADALIALNLGVNDVKRHASVINVRR